MRTLNRYIFRDYLVIFLTALGLITFVMTVGSMIKAVDLMARGISGMLILRFFLQNIPYILSFSMPISTLFSALLLFGRLSTDSEISAMKSCGLSLWRLSAPLILFSILLTTACIYINCEAAPAAKQANRELLRSAEVDQPVHLLEEGRFISDFPGLMIYVGRKNGNAVKDVIAYEIGKDGVRRSVRARQGEVVADQADRVLTVKLYDVRIEIPDPKDPLDVSKTTYINAEYYPVRLDFKQLTKAPGAKKKSNMTMAELLSRIRRIETDFPLLAAEDLRTEKSRYLVEANRRISLAAACFTFMLLGIPLGVKSHRKESSAGMVLSLGIVFVYYIFIVVANALSAHPRLHPNLFLWIPLIAAQIAGFHLIRRAG